MQEKKHMPFFDIAYQVCPAVKSNLYKAPQQHTNLHAVR